MLFAAVSSILLVYAAARADSDSYYDKEASTLKKNGFCDQKVDSLLSCHTKGGDRALRSIPGFPDKGYGEKLVFSVKWGAFNAGRGIMTMTPGKDGNTTELTASGITTPFVSSFYPVRDYVRCVIDSEGFYPKYFEENLSEGKYRSHRWAVYDHENQKVHALKKKHQSDELPPFSQTYLSAFYYYRTLRSKMIGTVKMRTFMHGKPYDLAFDWMGKEKVALDIGEFDCYKIRVRITDKAMVFREGDEVFVWLTADRYHMPVKVSGDIKLGTIRAELVDYEQTSTSEQTIVNR